MTQGTAAGMAATYSVPELDRIVNDIFELKKGGSACASILPEEEVKFRLEMPPSVHSLFCSALHICHETFVSDTFVFRRFANYAIWLRRFSSARRT